MANKVSRSFHAHTHAFTPFEVKRNRQYCRLRFTSNARGSVRVKVCALEWYKNTQQTAFVIGSLFSVALRGELKYQTPL